MKKTLMLLVLGLGMTSVANAQYEPKKGDIATEIGFTPFNTKDGESFKLNEGMFKVRYFLTDKDALRLKLGVKIDNSSTTTTDGKTPVDLKNAEVWNSVTEINKKYKEFSFMLGYERHLAVSGRFDVYVGAEFGYKINKYSGDLTYNKYTTTYDGDQKIAHKTQTSLTAESTDCQIKDDSSVDTNGNPDINTEYKSNNAFVGGIFAGADFYVYKNLYLGVELGISFESGKSPNSYYDYNGSYQTWNSDGKETYSRYVNYSGETGTKITTTTPQGNKTEIETVNNKVTQRETTTTKLNFYVEPAIRLGWRF